MRYGIVAAYFEEKGYGFIKPDQGNDVFFHVTSLGGCNEFPQITLGQPVKFELEPRKRTEESTLEQSGPTKKGQRRAKLVELIDKLPGGELVDEPNLRPKRHPKARRKKASWRE